MHSYILFIYAILHFRKSIFPHVNKLIIPTHQTLKHINQFLNRYYKIAYFSSYYDLTIFFFIYIMNDGGLHSGHNGKINYFYIGKNKLR